MNPAPKRPFNFRFQSQSPVLGCLMLVVGLIIALVLGVVGILALLWRLITSPFSTRRPSPQVDPSNVDAIDVESITITDASLPTIREEHERE